MIKMTLNICKKSKILEEKKILKMFPFWLIHLERKSVVKKRI